MNLTIVGTGYVGLVTGAAFAYLGHKVVCLDTDEEKIRSLQAGQLPIYEPGLDELMKLGQANIHFTTRYKDAIPGANVVFITVGTPLSADGSPNLAYVAEAAERIGLTMGEGYTLLVNKSTVPIGSGNWVESIVRDSFGSRNGPRPHGGYSVASNTEFLN